MLKGTVLVVDDDESICEDIKSRLNDEFPEAQVLIKNCIKSAKDVLKTKFINVVVTDMFMESKEDGYELLKFIKDKKPLTQVIVLTWYPEIDNVVKCMRIGCFGYISKKDEKSWDKLLETTKEALELSNYPVEREALLERLILCYWNEMQKAKKADKKGIALESLCSLIFRTIPGWQQNEIRVKSDTEEIDIVILNKNDLWQLVCSDNRSKFLKELYMNQIVMQ